MVDLTLRTEVAVRGVRVEASADAPLRRRAGAGPSDDGHVLIGGLRTALPIVSTSPYSLRDGRLLHDGTDLGVAVQPVRRPAFYDLTTVDGVPYEQLARLHGSDVLATTVVQTCARYAEPTRCRFCAIEASLAAGSTTAVKTPAQLAEVAAAAVRLDGVTQMVMTTGTSTGRDRRARHLARCTRAVKEAVPQLPVQVQCEPPAPDDLAAITELHDAGADAIGIHVDPSTTPCAAAGCRARPRSRSGSTGLPGTRRSGSSVATASPPTCSSGWARTRTRWSPGRPS